MISVRVDSHGVSAVSLTFNSIFLPSLPLSASLLPQFIDPQSVTAEQLTDIDPDIVTAGQLTDADLRRCRHPGPRLSLSVGRTTGDSYCDAQHGGSVAVIIK